jgi:hypothetical protein
MVPDWVEIVVGKTMAALINRPGSKAQRSTHRKATTKVEQGTERTEV